MVYIEGSTQRDLRIDFMRGMVMLILIVVHIEIFSWFNFIAWERIGLISGAEGFVVLSGYVLGQVHKRLSEKSGFKESFFRLLDRSFLLYKINIYIVIFILLLSALPFIDLSVVKTFKDWNSGEVYQLFPDDKSNWYQSLVNILLLRNSPHQIQILGLYCSLLLLTPIVIWLFNHGKVRWVCFGCVLLYLYNITYPTRITLAQFEYAFPLFSWQILYISGLAVGYFKPQLQQYITGNHYNLLVIFCGCLTVLFLLLAWNSPNPSFPEGVRLLWLDENSFNKLHYLYFDKNKLGILRLVNYASFLIFFYWCLTTFWQPINRLFGWFFIPLGQASLYVFIMHLIFIVLVESITGFSEIKPTYQTANIWWNTVWHCLSLLGLWLMVKKEFLYNYVPR